MKSECAQEKQRRTHRIASIDPSHVQLPMAQFPRVFGTLVAGAGAMPVGVYPMGWAEPHIPHALDSTSAWNIMGAMLMLLSLRKVSVFYVVVEV